MATATNSQDRKRRFGRAAVRLVAAALLVLVLHGALTGTAGAETNTPKGTFIKNCHDSGGHVMEGGGKMEGTVWCTHRAGGSIVETTCEFNGPILWVCTGQVRPSTN